MTKEDLEKEAYQYDAEHLRDNGTRWYHNVTIREAYIAGAEPREKRIAELEEKISVLLSCKNCPDNKGGYICEKEYENKCLTQKIQFIKELQEENTELEKELAKRAEQIEALNKDKDYFSDALDKQIEATYKVVEKLTEAKALIRNLLRIINEFQVTGVLYEVDMLKRAEQFIKEV